MTHPAVDQPRRNGKYAERHRRDGSATLESWREQDVLVMGKRFKLGDVAGGRLFHGTRADLPDGTLLEPGHDVNFTESSPTAVSITSSAATAAYWANQAGGDLIVYEVEPVGAVEVWRAGLANRGASFELHEGRVAGATILNRIIEGNAR